LIWVKKTVVWIEWPAPFACLATRLDEGESRELASFMDGHRVPSVFDLCRIEQVVISGAANIATRWPSSPSAWNVRSRQPIYAGLAAITGV
jgi:hypothetical protein